MQRHITCLLFAFVCALTAAPAWAQEYQLLQTINPDFSGEHEQDDDPGPQFGYSMAADENVLMVGLPRFVASDGSQTGTVDRFERTNETWQFASRNDMLGISGDYTDARCGEATAAAGPSGSRYVQLFGCPFADFDGATDNGISRISHRTPGHNGAHFKYGGSSDDWLGWSMDAAYLSNTPVYAVGAPAGNYVLIGVPWASEYITTLYGSGQANEAFGSSVSLAVGGPQCCPLWVAVGAPGWNVGRGKVYVYYYHRFQQQWVLTDELIAPENPQPGDNFGAGVLYHPGENLLDPSDDWLAIGAPARKIDGSTSASVATRGTVSVFRHGAQTGTFVHHGDVKFSQTVCNFEGQPEACDDTNQHMNFGRALAVDGFGNLWIGAPRFDQGGAPEVGRVYRARWGEATPTLPLEGWWVRSMLSPGPLGDDCGFIGTARSGGRFGWALATLPGAAIAVGYPQRGCQALTFPPSDPGPRRGQVRIYGIPNGIFADRFEE